MKYEVIEDMHVVYDEEKGRFQSECRTIEDALEFAVTIYNTRSNIEVELKEIIKRLKESIEKYKSPMFKEIESDVSYMKDEERELRSRINEALSTY